MVPTEFFAFYHLITFLENYQPTLLNYTAIYCMYGKQFDI